MTFRLPKKLGADVSAGPGGEWGGYYYQIFDPVVTDNWAGTNEFSLNWALPVIADYADFTRMVLLLNSSGSYSATGMDPVDSQPTVEPSLQPDIDQTGSGLSSAYTWGYDMYTEEPAQNYLPIRIERALDFMGYPTGSMTWNLTVEVYGILWVRGTFDPGPAYAFTP